LSWLVARPQVAEVFGGSFDGVFGGPFADVFGEGYARYFTGGSRLALSETAGQDKGGDSTGGVR
jgi:hypothetical protein